MTRYRADLTPLRQINREYYDASDQERDVRRYCYRLHSFDSQAGEKTRELIEPIVDGIDTVHSHLPFIVGGQRRRVRC